MFNLIASFALLSVLTLMIVSLKRPLLRKALGIILAVEWVMYLVYFFEYATG